MGGGEGGSKASRDVFAFLGPKRGTTFTEKNPLKLDILHVHFYSKKGFIEADGLELKHANYGMMCAAVPGRRP